MNINESLQRPPDLRTDSFVAREGTVGLGPAVQASPGAAAIATPPQKAGANDNTPSAQALDHAISSLRSQVQSLQRSLQFSIDKDSGEVVVKIVDMQTREVIRQIPSQELLDLANSLKSMTGLILKEKV